jgi:hypothetical protein
MLVGLSQQQSKAAWHRPFTAKPSIIMLYSSNSVCLPAVAPVEAIALCANASVWVLAAAARLAGILLGSGVAWELYVSRVFIKSTQRRFCYTL